MFAGSPLTQPVPAPGALPRPAAGEVVVWWATTNVSPGALEGLRADLDDDTRARANAFVRQEDRQRAIVAHGLLRRVLASMLGGNPSDVHLVRKCVTCGATDHGKPALPPREGGTLPALQFNLTHSGPVVAVALAAPRTPIGVDVEVIRPELDWSATRRHVFSDQEWALTSHAADPPAERFQLWARKESVVKATGDGLSLELATVQLGAAPGDATPFRSATIARQSTPQLLVADLALTPEVAAAVAVSGATEQALRPPTVVHAEL